jgi:hypothetical protein
MRPIDGDMAKELAKKLDTYAWTDFCSLIDSIPTLKNIPTDSPTDTPTRQPIHKQQTNGDRIRAMTDEELARFISDQEFEAYDTAPGLAGEILEWLKEEAKDK